MLREIRNVRQIPGEDRRRWFMDDDMDLFVWVGADDSIVGFQLAYGKLRSEHAVTWRRRSGFEHNRVDDGENAPGPKRTPILVPDGEFAALEVAEEFRGRAAKIDRAVFAFVHKKLLEFPDWLRLPR